MNPSEAKTLNISFEGKYLDLDNIKCKQFYKAFVSLIKKKPAAVEKSHETYDIDQDTWRFYVMLPFNVCTDTELQTLQYKIIHRFFPCNYVLSIWYSDIHSSCQLNSCLQKTDTLQHYFFHCTHVSVFWNTFMGFWKRHTGFNFVLEERDVIFGVLNPFKYDHIDILNYCIIYAKFYIYQCKKDSKNICFFEFLILLKNKIEILHYISIVNDTVTKFNKKWSILHKKF